MRVHRWLSLALLVVAGCGAAPRPARAPERAGACGGGPYAVGHATARLSRPGATPGTRRAGDPVAWDPVGRAPRGCRFPLLVFSHGHNGSPGVCERLCSRLARSGFVVLAPHHADPSAPRPLPGPERVQDLLFLLDHLPPAARGARPLGVLGHSFGGRTAAEVASQDDRV